jgi:hypothetical protein
MRKMSVHITILDSHCVHHSDVLTTLNEPDLHTINVIVTKNERQSVVIPARTSDRALPSIDATYFVKLEDTVDHDIHSSSSIAIVPSENMAPVATLPAEASPIFSQPNLPARLYFSPTLLHDEDDNEYDNDDEHPVKVSIKKVLTQLDENQIGNQ